MGDKPWMQPISRGGHGEDGPAASEAMGQGVPGSVNGGTAGLPTPRPAGSFTAPPELDTSLYDPNTGFGLFGTAAFGTRFGQSGPLTKIEHVRPLCMDFFKQGFCNRRGPHNQGCLFRHDEIEGKGKIVDETAVAAVSWQVEVFAAEAQGRQRPTGKAAYTDMARAAASYAVQKKKELAAAEAAAKAMQQQATAPAAVPAGAPAAEAPLPAGWKSAKAPDGRTYYYHTETKKTVWTRPEGPPAESLPPLPAGWKEAKAPDGRSYYFYPGGSTQWTRPTEPAPGAAPPATMTYPAAATMPVGYPGYPPMGAPITPGGPPAGPTPPAGPVPPAGPTPPTGQPPPTGAPTGDGSPQVDSAATEDMPATKESPSEATDKQAHGSQDDEADGQDEDGHATKRPRQE